MQVDQESKCSHTYEIVGIIEFSNMFPRGENWKREAYFEGYGRTWMEKLRYSSLV